MPGELRISWSINTGYNGCGFNKDDIHKYQFIVTVTDLFGETLESDTVNQNYYVVRESLTTNPVEFVVEELGNPNHMRNILLKTSYEILPKLDSRIDTINFYLLNGYFYNAMSLIGNTTNPDLLDLIKTDHRTLFPDNYPKSTDYFNSYVDSSFIKIKKMPTVDGFDPFLSALNELGADSRRTEGFKVYGKVTPDGTLTEYEVVPSSDKQTFEKVVHLLIFSNRETELSSVVIIIGRSKNNKRFTIGNERALMDQQSKAFKKEFPRIGGAIH